MKYFIFFCLFPVVSFASSALIFSGNTTVQTHSVDSGVLRSSGHLDFGVGYLNAFYFNKLFTTEFGAFYTRRKFGSENDENILQMNTIEIPLGLRFRFKAVTISVGGLFWQGIGDIESSGDESGSYSKLGYNNNGLGLYAGFARPITNRFFTELRYVVLPANLSTHSEISTSMSEFQIFIGYILGMTNAPEAGEKVEE